MPILDIHEDDVLLGRGALTVNNEGNKRFRSIVEPWKAEYQSANRKRKNEIAVTVVNEVLQRGGRFLERVDESQMQAMGLPEHCRAWNVAEMLVALEKAKQALRSKDQLPEHDHPDGPPDVAVQPARHLPSSSISPKHDDDDVHPKPQLNHEHPKRPLHEEQRAPSQYDDAASSPPRATAPPPAKLPRLHNPDLLTNPFRGSIHVNEQEQIDRLLRHDAAGPATSISTTAAATKSTTTAPTSMATTTMGAAQPSPHDSVLLNELAWIEQRNQTMVGGVHHVIDSAAPSHRDNNILAAKVGDVDSVTVQQQQRDDGT